jgi:ElaB/YqjD/DUF883 family membrane-anchored ribosome-binding protein
MTVATEKLVNDFKEVVREGESKLRDVSRDLTSKARERMSVSVVRAKDTCKAAEEQLRVAAKRTDATVRQHPYAAVGIGLAVGLLVGAVLLRRK